MNNQNLSILNQEVCLLTSYCDHSLAPLMIIYKDKIHPIWVLMMAHYVAGKAPAMSSLHIHCKAKPDWNRLQITFMVKVCKERLARIQAAVEECQREKFCYMLVARVHGLSDYWRVSCSILTKCQSVYISLPGFPRWISHAPDSSPSHRSVKPALLPFYCGFGTSFMNSCLMDSGFSFCHFCKE